MKSKVVAGHEWQLINGSIESNCQEACISQLGPREICWNASLNGVYRTLEISGWPKLIIWMEGPNWYGKDSILGYGCIPLPNRPGRHD